MIKNSPDTDPSNNPDVRLAVTNLSASLGNLIDLLGAEAVLAQLPALLQQSSNGNAVVATDQDNASPDIGTKLTTDQPNIGIASIFDFFRTTNETQLSIQNTDDARAILPGQNISLRLGNEEITCIEGSLDSVLTGDQHPNIIPGIVAVIDIVLGRQPQGLALLTDTPASNDVIKGPTLVISDLKRSRHASAMKLLLGTAMHIFPEEAHELDETSQNDLLERIGKNLIQQPFAVATMEPKNVAQVDPDSLSTFTLTSDHADGTSAWLNLRQEGDGFVLTTDAEPVESSKTGEPLGRISLTGDIITIQVPDKPGDHFASPREMFPQLVVRTPSYLLPDVELPAAVQALLAGSVPILVKPNNSEADPKNSEVDTKASYIDASGDSSPGGDIVVIRPLSSRPAKVKRGLIARKVMGSK